LGQTRLAVTALVRNQEPLREGSGGNGMYAIDTWEYGIADLDPQNDRIRSTQGPLPLADGDEMISDLMNYLLRVGSIGWELIAVAPLGDKMRLFFKKRRMDDA
jgi:hypothetical protein